MKMKSDIERRDMLVEELELRVDGDGSPTVEGYAAVFNSLSEPIYEPDNGRFREMVAPGAFAKTLREQNIPLLVEHADLPLATTRAGTLKLWEDDHGLRFSSMLDASDPDVMRLVPKMRRGDMARCSFGFFPVRETWDQNARPRVRKLHEVKLYDVSIVARPAYPATEAKVRKALADDGLDVESLAELFVRIRQGLELNEEDVTLLRRVATTCQTYLEATDAEAAPDPEVHPAEADQPAETTSAPDVIVHPLSWYKEQLAKMGA